MYIKDTADSDFGFHSYSSVDYGDTDVFWNHAVILQNVDNIQRNIVALEKFYGEKGKSPAFYLPLIEPVKDIQGSLRQEGFEKSFTDAWMFYTGEELPEGNEDVEMEEVRSDGEMERFVDLFYQSHAAGLDDPYAGLCKQYGEQLKKKFSRDFAGFTVRHFIAKLNGGSVGHITTVDNQETAAIYNLGTIPDCRGEGIATATLRETVEKLKISDLDQIFLQTEKGSKNEDFFDGRAFETRLEAECLTESG
jgi:N-acetylglutamate synthase-like GNAT family acetyltransferase